METSPRLGLPRPTLPTEGVSDSPVDLPQLFYDRDVIFDQTVIYDTGTLDERPGSGIVGRLYITTDAPGGRRLDFDTGFSWVALARADDARFSVGAVPIGGMVPYAGYGDPAESEFVVADGRLIDKTTYASFFARVGHYYNNGVDPGANKVRIPDKRGRAAIGAINMGTGAAANDNSHVQAVRGERGGEVNHTLLLAELASHQHGVTDPGHTHTLTDPGHNHGVTDPGHNHTVTDPGHNHGVTDPGHRHTPSTDGYHLPGSPSAFALAWGASGGDFGVVKAIDAVHDVLLTSAANTGESVNSHGTDVSINNRNAGVSVNGNTTGMSLGSRAAGVSVQASGSGTAHNNVSPYEADVWLVRIA